MCRKRSTTRSWKHSIRALLTDQEVQVELNRIAEQTKTKITMKPSELADFTLTRQVAQELGR